MDMLEACLLEMMISLCKEVVHIVTSTALIVSPFVDYAIGNNVSTLQSSSMACP